MTDYKDIKEASAGVPSTHAKAPPVTASLYEETVPALYMSELAYGLSQILRESRNNDINLVTPDDFPVQDMGRYWTDSADFTEDFNEENGMSLYDIDNFVKANRDVLVNFDNDKKSGFLQTILQRVREDLGGDDRMKEVFLTHMRAIQEKVACVYIVVKDTVNDRIIVAFRGSQSPTLLTHDWRTNINAVPVPLPTPPKIKHKMPPKWQENILVHKGFRNYLFKNKRMEDDQRYVTIMKDIRKAMKGEKGYNVYITGHSLGGALATMFSYTLAGAGGDYDDIPRPITCISFSAPFSGTRGYRVATEHLERDGFLRSLRVVCAEDWVPTIPFFSLIKHRLMKHTGINLRLTSSGHLLEHSSRANFMTALRNTVLKPCFWRLFRVSHWHSRTLLNDRIESHAEEFKKMKLDDLYTDESIVSSAFVAGNI